MTRSAIPRSGRRAAPIAARRSACVRARLALSLALGALAGCQGGGLANPAVPPPGSTPAFSDGYVDGCYTGYADAGREGYQPSYRRDAARMQSDADYRQGFERGHAACYEDERRHPKMTGADMS